MNTNAAKWYYFLFAGLLPTIIIILLKIIIEPAAATHYVFVKTTWEITLPLSVFLGFVECSCGLE